MDTNLRLIVSAATTYGEIELSGFEKITIKKAINDIKDLSVKKGSFTQNFTIPGTRKNNKLLNHIFEIGADSTFDTRLKAKCWLLENSISVMDGVFQLTNISVDNAKKVTYEVIIYGETTDLLSSIGEGYIEDMDFTDLNHTLSFSAVTNSWSADTGYRYGLVDYGYDLSLNDINGINSSTGLTLSKIFPALKVKTVFDKIMSEANKTYTSTFLTGATFNNWFMPFNGDASGVKSSAEITPQLYRAATTASTLVHYTGYTSIIFSGANLFQAEYLIRMPASNDSTNGNFDNGFLYDNGSFTYTGSSFSVQQFAAYVDYNAKNALNGGATPIKVGLQIFRSSYGGGLIPFAENAYLAGGGQSAALNAQIPVYSPILNGTLGSIWGPVQPGETFWFGFVLRTTVNKSIITGTTGIVMDFNAGGHQFNNVTGEIVLGTPVTMQKFVPKKFKKIDFVKSILTMANMIVEPNPDNINSLTIEPINTYFSGGTIKNWTNKLDLSKKVGVQLISGLQPKKTIFSYKADKDYLNEYYTDNVNRIYGDYIYENDNSFNKDEKKIEVIFSPTPCDNIRGSDTVVVPKIFKRETNNTYGRTDHNIRILQSSLAEIAPTGSTFVLQGQDAGRFYPALNHLSHPLTGTTDINWDAQDQVYWTLNSITENNLVNTYWKKSLNEYNDKNAKIVTAYFNLTAADVNQFKFNDSIYVRGLTNDGGHYFRVQSIEYSPTNMESSKVELIKIIETTITAGTKTIYQDENIFNQTARSSISMGGSKNYGRNSIAIGEGNMNLSDNAFVLGTDNTILNNANGGFIIGSGNTISSGLENVFILGNNISGVTGNTLYTTNINVTSAITIGNIVFQSSGSSLGLWTGSTGVKSIIANNGTNNSAGTYSIAIGYNSNALGMYSSVLGGIRNVAYSTGIGTGHNSILNGNENSATTEAYSTVLNGVTNLANSKHSLIGNGNSNSAITQPYTTVVNGFNNLASATYSLIGNGGVNQATGSYSSILNGKSNSATTSFSNVLGGNSNLAIGICSTILNGSGNTTGQYYSSILNGKSNTIEIDPINKYTSIISGKNNLAGGSYSFIGNGLSNTANTIPIFGTFVSILNGKNNYNKGEFSTILNGSGNTINENLRNVSILGGCDIIASSDNTSYVPNLAIQAEKEIFVATGGTNPTSGLVTLVGGTATVTTNKITANSMILPFGQNSSGTAAELTISAKVVGTSFTITSSSVLDTRNVFWILLETY